MDWDIVAVVAAGLSVFLAVLAVLWPWKLVLPVQRPLTDVERSAMDAYLKAATQTDTVGPFSGKPIASALDEAVHRRGRHLRTD